MIISTDAAFDKIRHQFMKKTLNKAGKPEIYLTIIKVIYEKPLTNFIFNGEKLKAFLLR